MLLFCCLFKKVTKRNSQVLKPKFPDSFMLYLIGLGLNEKSYSWEAYNAIQAAEKIYIENYTVEFPYDIKLLEKQFKGKKFIHVDRDFVESFRVLQEAKNTDVALLVYGNPLTATTHITLLEEAKKSGIRAKVIYNASIIDAVAETGLQLYKFGKIASMPGFEADSYLDIVKDNSKIKAHSLILVDIGLQFDKAMEKLMNDIKNNGVKLNKIIVCERLGTKDSKIYYGKVEKLTSLKIKAPFCIIIPSELHFMEEEVLEGFEN